MNAFTFLIDKINSTFLLFLFSLSSVDLHISELSKAGLAASAKSVLNQLDFAESESLDECMRLYEQANENVTEMIDLTRANLIENGNHNLNALNNDAADDELNMKLVQMKLAHQTSHNNLQSLRATFTQSLAKEKVFTELHESLKAFIQLKSSQLDKNTEFSASLAKIVADREAHEAFIGELVANSDDIKKVIEFYNNKLIECEDESLNEIVNDLETSWNGLCAKSDVRKEKLYVNFSMAEQFEHVHAFLSGFLRETNALLTGEMSSEEIKLKISELENEKSLNLTKLCIGNELQQACDTDKAQIDEQMNDLTREFAALGDELNKKLKLRLEVDQHTQKFNETIEDYRKSLAELKNDANIGLDCDKQALVMPSWLIQIWPLLYILIKNRIINANANCKFIKY